MQFKWDHSAATYDSISSRVQNAHLYVPYLTGMVVDADDAPNSFVIVSLRQVLPGGAKLGADFRFYRPLCDIGEVLFADTPEHSALETKKVFYAI